MDYRVLIVDDSKLARMALSKSVITLYPNWRLVEAQNADAAMALALAERIDIALIDYNMPGQNGLSFMPGQDGLSFAADLLFLHPEMPMALISGNFQEDIVARTKALGLTFLEKPHWQDGLAVFLSDAERRLSGQ